MSANMSVRSVDEGGHTVQLEGNMGDLMDNMLVEGGSPLFNASMHEAPIDEEDYTQHLENNLNDIFGQINDASNIENVVNSSNISAAKAAPVAAPTRTSIDTSEDISNASTASIEFNGMNRSSLAGRASVNMNASFGAVTASTLGFSASEMLKRLQDLNAGSRRKSLSQCNTPLGQIRRASLRRSIALKQQQQSAAQSAEAPRRRRRAKWS